MRHELRCPTKLHGVMIDEKHLEVKCSSRFCGSGAGAVILHVIDTTTGEVVDTKRFMDPRKRGTTP